jgi:hypothetical protein
LLSFRLKTFIFVYECVFFRLFLWAFFTGHLNIQSKINLCYNINLVTQIINCSKS